jgi:hypothetical protein
MKSNGNGSEANFWLSGRLCEIRHHVRDLPAVLRQNDRNVLVWQAPTTVMNPTITQEFIDQEMPRDLESRKV